MSIETIEGPSPSDAERAADQHYAEDFAILTANFAQGLLHDRRMALDGTALPLKPAQEFVRNLRLLAAQIADGWGASDAQFPQQCFADHGPQILLRAMARAYDEVAQPNGAALLEAAQIAAAKRLAAVLR